jgi:hypothetical protein
MSCATNYVIKKQEKCTYEASVTVTSWFLFDFARSEIIRVTVGLGWTRARAFNPRFGQGWTYPSRPSGSNGLGFLSGRVTRARTFVRRIGSDRHTCSSSAQSEFRLIQKARIERSTLGLIIKFCSTNWTEQAILSEPESWASSGVLILGLGFEFCSSGWVGLKKSVRTQLDDHTRDNHKI